MQPIHTRRAWSHKRRERRHRELSHPPREANVCAGVRKNEHGFEFILRLFRRCTRYDTYMSKQEKGMHFYLFIFRSRRTRMTLHYFFSYRPASRSHRLASSPGCMSSCWRTGKEFCPSRLCRSRAAILIYFVRTHTLTRVSIPLVLSGTVRWRIGGSLPLEQRCGCRRR